MYSQKYLIRKSVMATLSAALFLGSTAFASGMALAATKPFPLPPMLHFTPIAPNTPVVQVTPMAKWNPEDMLDPDSKGGPAWGGLFDVEALGMSQNNPTSPQPSCPSGWGGSYNWPTKAQSIQWWESQPNNQALSNIQKYTYGTKQHFEWIVGTEYSHQDEMGWQDDCVPPPPPPSYPSVPGGNLKTIYGYDWNFNTMTYTTADGQTAPITEEQGQINGTPVTIYSTVDPETGTPVSQIVYDTSSGNTKIVSTDNSGSQLLENGNGTVEADDAKTGTTDSNDFAGYTISGTSLTASGTEGGGACPVGDTSAACQKAKNITNNGSYNGGGANSQTANGKTPPKVVNPNNDYLP